VLGLVTASDVRAFATPACTVTAPASGAAVGGRVMLVAAPTDAVSVQFTLDGAAIGSAVKMPYGWFASDAQGWGWDSTTVADGTHALACVATASDGSTAPSAPRSVLVDNTPPLTTIATPTDGSPVMGTSVGLLALASDPNGSGVDHVDFELDGQPLGRATHTPYGDGFAWNSTTAAPGAHSIVAITTDHAGNAAPSAAVRVVVTDPNVIAPAPNAPVRGTVLLNALSTGATAVSYRLNGTTIGGAVSTLFGWLESPDGVSVGWNSTSVPDGTYLLSAVATHSDGTTTTSANLPIRVDNTVPVASVAAPASGASLTGVRALLAATATDASGISKVQFAVDGALVGTASKSAYGLYTFAWNSQRVFNGTHSVSAIATDAAGNSAPSPPVSFNASNTTQLVAQETGVSSPGGLPGTPPILNDTTRYGVNGTDLGVTWDDGQGHVLLAFGDTVGAGWVGPGSTGGCCWRWNVLGRSSDTRLDDGVTFSFFLSPTGSARPFLLHEPGTTEITVTPTAGISVGTRQYVFYVSQRRNNRETNYAGFAYSDDDGQTWVRDPNAKWQQTSLQDDPFQYGSLVLSDGYVYLFGTQTYRWSGVRVARVPAANVLVKSAWQYWDGSTWQTGNEGAAVEIIPRIVGEASVWYSATVGRWIMVYTGTSGILMRQASSLNSGWSAPTVLVSSNDYGSVYGGFIHPWSSGHDLYFNVTSWSGYAVYLFHTTI